MSVFRDIFASVGTAFALFSNREPDIPHEREEEILFDQDGTRVNHAGEPVAQQDSGPPPPAAGN